MFWSENLKRCDHSEDRRRWEDSIKIDVKENALKDMDWICLAQDRVQWRAVVNRILELPVP
jgi:hypothetical protein